MVSAAAREQRPVREEDELFVGMQNLARGASELDRTERAAIEVTSATTIAVKLDRYMASAIWRYSRRIRDSFDESRRYRNENTEVLRENIQGLTVTAVRRIWSGISSSLTNPLHSVQKLCTRPIYCAHRY